MRRSIDDAPDDTPTGDPDLPPVWWRVMIASGEAADGGDAVLVVLEERDDPGSALVARLSAANAARLRAALTDALTELGAEPRS